MNPFRNKIKIELTFTGAPNASIPTGESQLIINRLTKPDFWIQDLGNWLQIIRSDLKMTCPEIVRKCSSLSMGLEFIDDHAITELNTLWRNISSPTDVLSFPALDSKIKLPIDQCVELGDVFVSVTTARKQADFLNHELVFELRWLVCHGLLHLLGWDHPNEEKLTEMLSYQERLLNIQGKFSFLT